MKSTKPICLPTWVVFDGEIWVVEHLWDEAVVEEVALDGVVSIHRADNLDHLCQVEGDASEGAASPFVLCLALAAHAASHLLKYSDNSFWDFEIIINELLPMSAAHF